MPELLQVIANGHARSLSELGDAIDVERREMVGLPGSQQLHRALEAARTSLPEVPMATRATVDWIKQFEDRLRKGVNGNRFRLLATTGDRLVQTCLDLVDRVGQLWDRVEGLGGEADEVNGARKIIGDARTQLMAFQPQMAQWRKLSDRQGPDLDLSLVERGAEQIRQGLFKTGEQLREEIRSRRSPG